MKFKKFLLLAPIILLTQCSFNNYKYTSGDSRDADGKCYALCRLPVKHETISNEYAIYTGDESKEAAEIETIELLLVPASTKWVKKKADRNCLSADPNDCLVWCMVDTPAEKRVIRVLTDTTQSQNFVMETIGQTEIELSGGHTEMLEVLCDNNITREILAQIQDTLKENGYLKKDKSFVLDEATKEAITKFQKINSLPEGQLDFETLEALGIVF